MSSTKKQQQNNNQSQFPLWLGVPIITETSSTTATATSQQQQNASEVIFDSRIGGKPVWMFHPSNSLSNAIKCPVCDSSNDVALLSQILAPLFCLDRCLYVFVCRKCAKPNTSSSITSSKRNINDTSSVGGGNSDPRAFFVVRCQNLNPEDLAEQQELLIIEEKKKQELEQKQKEEEERKQKASTISTFAVEDDWGDDDDDNTTTSASKQSTFVAPKTEEQVKETNNNNNSSSSSTSASKVSFQEQEKKKQPQQQQKHLPMNPTFGNSLKKCFMKNEKVLDIFPLSKKDQDQDDDDDDDEDDDTTAVASSGNNNAISAAQVQKQLEEVKKKYPNVEIAMADGNDEDISEVRGGGVDDDDEDDFDEDNNTAAAGSNKKSKKNKSSKNKKSSSESSSSTTSTKPIQEKNLIWDSFLSKISKEPSQVIRWQPNGIPLLATAVTLKNFSSSTTTSSLSPQQQKYQMEKEIAPLLALTMPKCEKCGASRMFEFQLMAPLIYFLGEANTSNEDLSFATILVFTCSASCDIKDEYVRECLMVQFEP